MNAAKKAVRVQNANVNMKQAVAVATERSSATGDDEVCEDDVDVDDDD